jgi:hypothetical protein
LRCWYSEIGTLWLGCEVWHCCCGFYWVFLWHYASAASCEFYSECVSCVCCSGLLEMRGLRRFEGSCSHRAASLRVFGRLGILHSITLPTRPFFDIVKVHNLAFTTMSVLDCSIMVSDSLQMMLTIERNLLACQSLPTACSGRHLNPFCSLSSITPSIRSTINCPTTGIIMKPMPEPPAATTKPSLPYGLSIRNWRSTVSASQQILAKLKSRSAI